jgi:hypothetical protein
MLLVEKLSFALAKQLNIAGAFGEKKVNVGVRKLQPAEPATKASYDW